jgi:predicted transcriptional regulator
VPVVDDQDVFIGIVRRREIIEYCAELIREQELDSAKH